MRTTRSVSPQHPTNGSQSLAPRVLLAVYAALFPCVSAEAQPAAAVHATKVTSVEGITEYSLPNGLRVLLVPDPSKPTTTVNITYLVGSRHEGYGETGMAHLIEHMVFKGSTHHTDIPQELTVHGSRPNGTTWFDRTNYFETTPATDANLDWALDLEADRMVNSFIAKKDLESEFSVVRNEFEVGENSPFRVLLDRTMSTAYLWHGYGRETVGDKSDIEHVPIERLQAFYKKHYQPDNAVLVVAGKFDPARTLTLIEKKFGPIPRPHRTMAAGNLLFATYTEEPVQDGERSVTLRRTGDAPLLMSGYHVPAGAHPDFPAVSVLAWILGDSPSGRLYKALVDAKLAASVGAFAFQLREPGMLLTYSQLRAGQSLDSARNALERTLDASATSAFTTEEVERAKTSMLRDMELELNNSEYVGYDLTEWAAMGDWRLLFLHRDRVAKVNPADVQRVAARYLKPSNRTVAMFVPTPAPDRSEVPATPSIPVMVGGYQGHAVVQAGEIFDATPTSIDARTKRSTLASGMHVTLMPKQNRGGRVLAEVTLRYGSEQTLRGKVDVSGVLTDLLSRGTAQLTRQQVSDSLDHLHAQVNVYGGPGNTVVDLETTRPNVVAALDLIAQELRSPRLDGDELEKLKRETLAGLEEQKSEPQTLANIALRRALTPRPKGDVMYTPTVDEEIAGVSAVSLADVRAFHRSFYGASAGDVSVVGDFDATELSATVARLFGDWKNPQPFERIVHTYAPSTASVEKIETPDKANAVFRIGQNLELRDDDPDYAAMALANFMIGGGFLNSRLAIRIRQKEGISYGVGSNLSAESLDRAGRFGGGAIYAPQNVDRLVAAFREEIERVRKDGFTDKEVAAAKTGYLQGRSQARANDDELAGMLIARRFAGRTMAYDAEFEKRVTALTPEQIGAAVRKYLDLEKMVMVKAGDFAKHPPEKIVP